MRHILTWLMMFFMVVILTGCTGTALRKSPAPELTLEAGWLQTHNDKGSLVDIEGVSLLLPDGSKAFLRNGNRHVLLKCMPSKDADKYDNYIKFLKRR